MPLFTQFGSFGVFCNFAAIYFYGTLLCCKLTIFDAHVFPPPPMTSLFLPHGQSHFCNATRYQTWFRNSHLWKRAVHSGLLIWLLLMALYIFPAMASLSLLLRLEVCSIFNLNDMYVPSCAITFKVMLMHSLNICSVNFLCIFEHLSMPCGNIIMWYSLFSPYEAHVHLILFDQVNLEFLNCK